MIFQRINRASAEKVFSVYQNASGATITANYPVVLDVTATQANGVRVSQPATATLSLLVGIANADITNSGYGLVQQYGYRASALVSNDVTTAIAAGDCLVPVAAAYHLVRSAV